MPFNHNLKKVIDLPVIQWLRPLPLSKSNGTCFANDERGTSRYIYLLYSQVNFWAYDVHYDNVIQLASPPTGFSIGNGSAMIVDPSMGRVWALSPISSSPFIFFCYYDIATNTWTQRASPTGLSSWGTDACLVHTCSSYNSNANDDYIYLIGNTNSNLLLRYSISQNTWTSMANAPIQFSAGMKIHWDWNTTNPDFLYAIRGGDTNTIVRYSISSNSWTTINYNPSTETFGSGTLSAYNPSRRVIHIQKSNTNRILDFNIQNNTMTTNVAFPSGLGSSTVGNALCYVKSEDGAEYIYMPRQTGTEFWRALLF